MSTRTFMMSAAGAGESNYWVATYPSTSGTVVSEVLNLDYNSGNLYITGQKNNNGLFSRINYNDGRFIFSRLGSGASGAVNFTDQSIDNTGNIVIVGTETTTSNTVIMKYNTSGTVIWQNFLVGTTTATGAESVITDNTGNVFIGSRSGRSKIGLSFDGIFTKLNSSGTLQWTRQHNILSNDLLYNSMCFDSDQSNVYLVGRITSGLTGNVIITKYNTSNVIQWRRTFGDNITTGVDPASNTFYDVCVTSTGNVCAVGGFSGNAIITLLDSSGTIQWQRALGSGIFRGVDVDNQNNFYCVGSLQSNALIASYNSSGSLRFKRALFGNSATLFNKIEIDRATNDMYISGYDNGSSFSRGLVCKLPGDGRFTGNLDRYSYFEPSVSDSPGILVSTNRGTYVEQAGSDTLSTRTRFSNTDIDATVITDVPSNYWITLAGDSNAQSGVGLKVDSVEESYVITGNSLVKFNSSGNVIWRKTANTVTFTGLERDSTGNLYIVGSANLTVSSANVNISKYTSEGNIIWQKELRSANLLYGRSIALNSSETTVYVAGYKSAIPGSFPTGNLFLASYSTSNGSLNWQNHIGVGYENFYGRIGVEVESNGNVILVGTTFPGAGAGDALICRFNSSGTLLWSRRLGGATGTDTANDVTVDASDNIYIVGEYGSTVAGGIPMHISKYNNSGAFQWTREIGRRNASGDNEDPNRIFFDSSSNLLYVIANSYRISRSPNSNIFIAVYNTDGALQWQRQLRGTDNLSEDSGYDIVISPTGKMFFTGFTETADQGNGDIILCKFPIGGTGTGVIGPFTYEATNYSNTIRTPTNADPSFSVISTGATDTTPARVDGTGVFGRTTYKLP